MWLDRGLIPPFFRLAFCQLPPSPGEPALTSKCSQPRLRLPAFPPVSRRNSPPTCLSATDANPCTRVLHQIRSQTGLGSGSDGHSTAPANCLLRMWQRLFPGPRTSGPSQPPCHRRSATASLRLGAAEVAGDVPCGAALEVSAHVRPLPNTPIAQMLFPKLALSTPAQLPRLHFCNFQSCGCPVRVEGATKSDCLLRCGRLTHLPRFQLRIRPTCNLRPHRFSCTRVIHRERLCDSPAL